MFIRPIFDRPKSVSFMWPMEVMSKLQEKTDTPQCCCLLLGRPEMDQLHPRVSGTEMAQNQFLGKKNHSALVSWLSFPH